jgi:HEAT repeat protein
MLWREDTTDMARYALEKIPGKAADTALLAALEQTQNETKIGIISSLGQRKSVQAVKALAVLVNDADSALAAAATTAMGRIGGVEAAAALAEAYDRAAGEAKTNLAYALLSSADGYWDARNFPAALALYEEILSAHPQQLPLVVRRTAFKGRILCLEKPDASKLVVETLTKGPEDMHEPAIGEVAMLFRPADIGPVVEALPKLPEASGVQLLSILTQYPRENVLQAVIEATKSPALAVRVAALKALAIVGDSSSVLFLAERSAASAGREQLAARASLWKLVGKDIDEKVMFHLVSTPNEAVRNELIQAIRERRITQGKAHLLTVARGGSSRNIQEAARALRSIASPIDIPVLLKILLETGDETVQAEMQTTIGVVAKKIPDEYARANAVEKMLTLDTSSKEQPITDVTKRCLLYRTLGRIGDDSSLALLRTALQDPTVEIQDAAVRALADWPNGTPREECLAIARTSANFTHRVLALRAFVRMVGLQKYQSPQTAIQSLKTALDLATRPEEKKLVLGALEAFPSPEALALAESLLTAEGVQAEAQAAVDKIKETLEKK